MWAIHDLLAYGLLSGQVTKGYNYCLLTCGPNTCSCHLRRLGKTTFVHHRRWLWPTHPYWNNLHDFNGRFERRPAPLMMKGIDVLEHANLYEAWKSWGGREEDNLCLNNGVKWESCLFDLLYWKVNSNPHLFIGPFCNSSSTWNKYTKAWKFWC